MSLASVAMATFFLAPIASAAPILIDTTTKGSWVGHYGGDGYILSNFNLDNTDLNSLPSYISGISYTNASRFIWDGNTTDVRAVQDPNLATTTRHATTTYNNLTATLDVNQAAHFKLAVYALDWDGNGSRSETIQVSVGGDPAGSLDSVTSYQNGKWYVYDITAASAANDVTISLANGAAPSPNAVISAIMFDAVPEPGSLSLLGLGAVGMLIRRRR